MKYIRTIITGLIIMVTAAGCGDSYLDTAPTGSVSAPTVYENLSGLYRALNGIHRKMVSQDLANQGMGGEPGFMLSREAHGDDMTWSTQSWHQTHLTWAINTNPSSSYNNGVWKTYYELILNANKILEILDANFSSPGETLPEHIAKQRDQIKGESLAIRAWAHFQLVQYYAKRYDSLGENSQPGVPYRESSAPTEMARNTVKDVYTKINRDLDAALLLLKDYKAPDINHYTPKAVYGLKARVALTQQDYAKAAEYATQAITLAEADGHRLMTPDELMHGFANISTATKEAIYAALTRDDQTVYFYSFYAYMSWNFNSTAVRTGIKCISQSTYDMMSAGDLRRQWWDPSGTAAVPASNYDKSPYQNRKFTARSTANAVGDVAFMRLSELYLTAAEALARAGKEVDAKRYLHAFVTQRDPQYTGSQKTGNALAEEIMTHRRIELWGEGFRWFDLKRLNQPCERKGNNFSETFCGFIIRAQDADGWVYEIPKVETDYNRLMTLNY